MRSLTGLQSRFADVSFFSRGPMSRLWMTDNDWYFYKVFQSILFNFAQKYHSYKHWEKFFFFFFLTAIEVYLFILRQIDLELLVISRYEKI